MKQGTVFIFLTIIFRSVSSHLWTSNDNRFLASSPQWNCTHHYDWYGTDPDYILCQLTAKGKRYSYAISKYDYDGTVCYFINGKPARSSYACPTNTSYLYLDYRNLAPPRAKCMGVDCSGKCLPASKTQLKFKDTGNACARIGYTCVTTTYTTASCYWYSILGDGSWVRISTDEGPSWAIGNPAGFGYYGECYTKLGSKSCKSCSPTCREKNRNYAQFDCTNLRKDGCAKHNCSGCALPQKSYHVFHTWSRTSEQLQESILNGKMNNRASLAMLEPLEELEIESFTHNNNR